MKNEITKPSIQTSIATISNHSIRVTPKDAWELGTNVRSAFKTDPKTVHITLTALLKDAVDYLEMNKSFRHEGDYIEAVSYLIDEFPVMKLEEWKLICQRLKAGYYGTLYERLKLPELVDIFQRHEGDRAEMMERKIQNDRNEQKQKIDSSEITEDQKKLWKAFMKKLDLPEDDTDKNGRWKFIEHPNSPLEE